MKVQVDAFNQGKALVGASSVMVKSSRFILTPIAHDWSLDCGLISWYSICRYLSSSTISIHHKLDCDTEAWRSESCCVVMVGTVASPRLGAGTGTGTPRCGQHLWPQCTVKHHKDIINFACMTWNFVRISASLSALCTNFECQKENSIRDPHSSH